MHRVSIGRRVDCDGWDAQLAAGALNSQRDLSPIRDQDLLEQNNPLFNYHQKFTVLDRSAVLNDNFCNDSCLRRLNLIERLHRFNEQ